MSKWPYRDFMRADELAELEAIDATAEALDRNRQELTNRRGRLVAKALQRAHTKAIFPRSNVGKRVGPFHAKLTNLTAERSDTQ